MKCIQIAIITAILMLRTITFAQFHVHDAKALTLLASNRTYDLENVINEIGQSLNLSKITILTYDLGNSKGVFQNGSFKKFPALESLRVENGKIKDFSDGTFEGLPELYNLSLVNIGPSNISKNIFEPLRNLNTLTLKHNELTNLPNDIFEAISPGRLCHLNLSHNKLVNLSKEVFQPLGNLKRLYLNNNNISSLNGNVFSGVKATLRELDLNFNDIQYVHEKTFADMKELCKISMSRAMNPNGFNSLPSNIFHNSSILWHLQLDHNNLREFPEDIFRDLIKLEQLDLSHNSIICLSPNIFQNNKQLKVLNLEYNLLTNLSSSLFSNLIDLKELNLANNQLIFDFGTYIFGELFNLKFIKLDNNNITSLAHSDSFSILYNCQRLKKISAKNNNIGISEVYKDWLSMMWLEHLDLRNNPIILSQLNFTFQPKNAQLMLTSSSNGTLTLKNYRRLDTNSKDLGKRVILDKQQSCNDNCSCVFHIPDYGNIIRLKCQRFNAKELQPEIPGPIIPLSSRMKVEFNLSNCNISSASLGLISSYLQQINVTRLTLSKNRLNGIQELADKLSGLEILELDNNNFSMLDNNTIAELEKSKTLKKIKLDGNPWDCKCGFGYFYKFVAKYSEDRILNSDKVLCSNQNKLVKSYNEEDCQVIRYDIIYTCVCLAIFAVGCGSSIGLFYKYEIPVKVFMYTHNIFPSLVTEKEIDRGKIYDAFVSYAKEDEEFVTKRLVPELEEGEPPFKLCIHIRDWNVGDSIVGQIHRSVADSRRTIIVLSHAFLKSTWGRKEFQAAYIRFLREKCPRILVIMLEDIALDKLDDELRSYINENTYIPWKDNPWFWDKLRFKLPHKHRIRGRGSNTEIMLP